MVERSRMKEKMSRWGIGPIFTTLSLIYGLMTIIISYSFQPFFRMAFIPYRFLFFLGIFLIVIGFPFVMASAITVMRAYNADKLVTDGMFKFCRHPLYASWVVFIVPGIALLSNSWIALTTPIFMYFILYVLVKKEEAYLENVFSTEYANYKKKVPCILPYGFLK